MFKNSSTCVSNNKSEDTDVLLILILLAFWEIDVSVSSKRGAEKIYVNLVRK